MRRCFMASGYLPDRFDLEQPVVERGVLDPDVVGYCLCLLGEPKPERRQAVKAEAAKRGRDSASLCGLRPVRFTAVSSKRAQTSSLRI